MVASGRGPTLQRTEQLAGIVRRIKQRFPIASNDRWHHFRKHGADVFPDMQQFHPHPVECDRRRIQKFFIQVLRPHHEHLRRQRAIRNEPFHQACERTSKPYKNQRVGHIENSVGVGDLARGVSRQALHAGEALVGR